MLGISVAQNVTVSKFKGGRKRNDGGRFKEMNPAKEGVFDRL